MVTFRNRTILSREFDEWRARTIPHPVANVNTFISFLSTYQLLDDDLINLWCENREREEE